MVHEPATSSGQLTAGTDVVYAAPAALCSIILVPAAAACSVTIYDNASTNSGTILGALSGLANGASVSLNLTIPIRALKGLTAVVAGSGAVAYVNFQPMW